MEMNKTTKNPRVKKQPFWKYRMVQHDILNKKIRYFCSLKDFYSGCHVGPLCIMFLKNSIVLIDLPVDIQRTHIVGYKVSQDQNNILNTYNIQIYHKYKGGRG